MGAALATKQQTRVCPSSLNWCKEEKPHQLVACREELPLQSAPITSDFSSIHLFHAAVVHSAPGPPNICLRLQPLLPTTITFQPSALCECGFEAGNC